MSTSNEWEEWHLTPAGWVEGSHREDGTGETVADTPSDAVLSYRYMEWYSGPRQKFAVVPMHRGNDEEEIARLSAKYGQHPDSSWCTRVVRNA